MRYVPGFILQPFIQKYTGITVLEPTFFSLRAASLASAIASGEIEDLRVELAGNLNTFSMTTSQTGGPVRRSQIG